MMSRKRVAMLFVIYFVAAVIYGALHAPHFDLVRIIVWAIGYAFVTYIHSPLAGPPMIAGNRDVLLTAIAKARAWITDLAEGRAASFSEIAKREGKVERHIRLLAPLAFVSPQLVSGIIDGHIPSVAVTTLAKHVSWSWAQQRTDVSS